MGVFGSSLPLFAPLLSLHACGSVFGTGAGQPLPPFANPANSGAPARTKTKLRSNLPEWYHAHRSAVNCENHGDEAEKHGPPATAISVGGMFSSIAAMGAASASGTTFLAILTGASASVAAPVLGVVGTVALVAGLTCFIIGG